VHRHAPAYEVPADARKHADQRHSIHTARLRAGIARGRTRVGVDGGGGGRELREVRELLGGQRLSAGGQAIHAIAVRSEAQSQRVDKV
jgi:hypothetical protein